MILFGQTQNVTAHQSRQVRHLGVKKFVPVFERQREMWVPPNYFKGKESGYVTVPAYKKGELFYYWQIGKTTRPMLMWTVARIRRKRQGQKDFFKKIFEGK